MPSLAEMIELICAMGRTPEQIAAELDVTEQAVYTWRTGRVKKPRGDKLDGVKRLYTSLVGTGPAGGDHPDAPVNPPRDDKAHPSMPAATDLYRSGWDADAAEDIAPPPDRHATPPPRGPAEAFRFIHCADLHLDSPFKGIRKIDPQQAPWIALATRRAFVRLVDMAIDDDVDFVVIAGDLFDGEWKSADTGIFLSRQLSRLTAARIPVFAVTGNHDALSVVTRSVRWPEQATLFGTIAGSVELSDLGVVIHGRSFGDRYESSDFVDGYPSARPGLFNLGILHTSLTGDPGHAEYAPCTPVQLAGRGYDYWALGHVHVPRVIHTAPHIVYSGNIQGRDIGETGPRGCQVVTVDEARRPTVHFVPLDDVRWERVEVSMADIEGSSVDEVVAAVVSRLESNLPEEGRLLACRIEITGATTLHLRLKSLRGTVRDDILAVLGSQFDARICLEQVEVNTIDPDAVEPGPGPLPPRAIELLEEEFRRLENLPADALLDDEEDLRKLFDELRILDRLHPGRCEEIQKPDRWAAVVRESRDVLGTEIGELGDREGGDE